MIQPETYEHSAMISDEVGRQLHARETQGERLTPEERSQLDGWYAIQDAQEGELLQPINILPETSELRAQVNSAITHLTLTTQRIQEITTENETLRNEIALLRQQLSLEKSA